MTKEIFRNYLEIHSLDQLIEVERPEGNYHLKVLETKDFELNKFLYKNVGKKYSWIDRLSWNNQNWINYVSDKKLSTFILKDKQDIVGYFEVIYCSDNQEAEIAYFGILEEYFGKKLGGFLLSEALKKSFSFGANRVWVHTCSLDNPNALKNYISRGMKIFKTEVLKNKI